MDTSWRRGKAQSLILGDRRGALVGFARVEMDDGTFWVESQVPRPGRIGKPVKNGEQLGTDELLEALGRPLGAT